MLPKINRLRKTKEINNLFKKGRFCQNNFFVFRFIEKSSGVSRFTFVVSTKIDKRATIRNKIRRQMREIIKTRLPKIRKRVEAAIIPKKTALALSFEELGRQLELLLKKAKVL